VLSYHQDAGPLGPRFVERLEQTKEGPPAQRMERQELVAAVRRAVDGLTGRQRRALVLHKFDGLDYAAIARVMGLTTQAVKSLLMRARENLRAALAGYLVTGCGHPRQAPAVD
jgi:RNA polymerase sigma-70 factor (ECF subfamily)